MKMKKTSAVIWTVVAIALWINATTIIQNVKCPSMTRMELFMVIPKTVVCNWQPCKETANAKPIRRHGNV